MKFGLLGLLITAMVSGSFGFVLGGILSSGKVSDLYDRLRLAEYAIEQNNELNREFKKFLNAFVIEMGSGMGINSTGPTAILARDILTRL